MITAILIILTFIINCLLLVYIRWDQEYNWENLKKTQHRMQDQITRIERNVKAIDKKIEDSTIYKTELRFMDK